MSPYKNINLIVLCCLTVLIVCSNNLPADAEKSFYRPTELVCRMEEGFEIDIVINAFELNLKSFQQPTKCYLLEIQNGQEAESLAQTITAMPEVQHCGPNYYLDAPEPYQRSQPFLDNNLIGDFVNQPAAADLNLYETSLISIGTGVRVAVIDGGVNLTHPEFVSKSGGVYSGWDYIDNDSLANDEPGGSGSGHGTFIAGIIKLTAPGAEIYAYRVLDTLGRGDGFNISNAILQAIEDSCKVINLSLGMIGWHDGLNDALKYAEKNNVVVVAAAGNDSTQIDYLFPFPAIKASCLAIASLDSNNIKAGYSNYGPKIDLCAPGNQIYAPYLDTLYAWWDGTSFAAPFTSGLAALIFSIAPDMTWDTIDTILAQSAINVDYLNPGLEGLLGAGLIDPVAALELVIELTCGDPDGSGSVNVSDAVYLINYAFTGGPPPSSLVAGDPNCSGNINVSDAVYLINYIFTGGPAPCNMCQ